MSIDSEEIQFLELLNDNQFERAYKHLDRNLGLLNSDNDNTITGIMSLLLIHSAYEDCIYYAKSKEGKCITSDYYYNLAYAYEMIEDWNCSLKYYSMSCNLSNDIDANNQVYNKMYSLLKLKNNNEGLEPTLFGQTEKLILCGNIINIEHQLGLQISERELYKICQTQLLLDDYDKTETLILETSKSRNISIVFLFMLVYISKKRKDVGRGLFFLNQVLKTSYIFTDVVKVAYDDYMTYFNSFNEINPQPNHFSLEDDLRLAYKHQLISKEQLKSLIKRLLPTTLILESYRGCNLKCPLCAIQGYNNFNNAFKSIDGDIFLRVLNDSVIMQNLEKIYLHNLGEPLLNKNLLSICSEIKLKYPNVFLSIDSNLSLPINIQNLVNSGLDEIVVAFDGYDQESYQKYRVNGNFSLMTNNIRDIVRYKNENNVINPKIIAKTIAFKHIEPFIEKVAVKVRECNVEHFSIQSPIVFNSENNEYKKVLTTDWIDIESEYCRYNKDKFEESGLLETNEFRQKSCKGIATFLSPTVNYNGSVFPCCVLAVDDKYSFGSIRETLFSELWKSDKYVDFRLNKLIGDVDYDICKYCDMT